MHSSEQEFAGQGIPFGEWNIAANAIRLSATPNPPAATVSYSMALDRNSSSALRPQ